MFKILDRYIAKKFLSTLFFILLMAGIISVIFDISEKTEDFIRNHLSTRTIIMEYYIHFIPNIINVISPILIFISTLYFTSRMANNTEIVAIFAGGISYWRFLRPYVMVGILICIIDLVLKNFVMPNAYYHVNNFEEKYVIVGFSNQSRNIHRQLNKNQYFYIQNFDVSTCTGYQFALENFDNGLLKSKIIADEAFYDTVRHNWRIINYIKRDIVGERESFVRGDSLRLNLAITNAEFNRKVRATPAMITPDLIKFIQDEKFRGETDINYYLIDLNKRFCLPFANIILILIAVSIASRKIRGGMGAHLLLGILVGISFELSMRFSTTFSTNGNLAPWLSVWIPVFIYGILAFVLIIKTPK